MNAIRISREPTQAFVQYMAWAGSGYTLFFNPFPPLKKTNPFIQGKKQKTWNLCCYHKEYLKMGHNTESVSYWLPQLCTGGPGWYLIMCLSQSGIHPSVLTKITIRKKKITVDGCDHLKLQQCLCCTPLPYTEKGWGWRAKSFSQLTPTTMPG